MTAWLPRAGAALRPALETREGAVSWAALTLAARRVAGGLRARGIGRGDVVAVLAEGRDFAEALHGVLWCGATLLPLNTRLAPREVDFQLRDASARALVYGGGPLAEQAAPLEHALSLPLAALQRAPADRGGPAAVAPDDPLAVVYTSGTSGRPKGVLLSHAAFRASALASARHLGVHPRERWLACLPLFHVGGLSLLLRSAVSGFPVLLQERFDPQAVSRALDEDDVTLVSLVPTMLARTLDARGTRPPPPALRCVLLGGAGAAPALLERSVKRGLPVAPSYGLTEAASQVATCPLARTRDPVGAGLAPLPGTALRIAADGEILVRGPTLLRAYVNRPLETAEALRDGWLHTGDRGRLDAEGRLHVLGRRDDLIVSGGENVDPCEIEAALCEHPDVAEAGVDSVPDASFGRRPRAWLVLRDGAHPTEDALRRFLRARLAGYKLPAAFHAAPALPRTASGKLARRRLAELSPLPLPPPGSATRDSAPQAPARARAASRRRAKSPG